MTDCPRSEKQFVTRKMKFICMIRVNNSVIISLSSFCVCVSFQWIFQLVAKDLRLNQICSSPLLILFCFFFLVCVFCLNWKRNFKHDVISARWRHARLMSLLRSLLFVRGREIHFKIGLWSQYFEKTKSHVWKIWRCVLDFYFPHDGKIKWFDKFVFRIIFGLF